MNSTWVLRGNNLEWRNSLYSTPRLRCVVFGWLGVVDWRGVCCCVINWGLCVVPWSRVVFRFFSVVGRSSIRRGVVRRCCAVLWRFCRIVFERLGVAMLLRVAYMLSCNTRPPSLCSTQGPRRTMLSQRTTPKLQNITLHQVITPRLLRRTMWNLPST